jgi:FkbM family methyltransferase
MELVRRGSWIPYDAVRFPSDIERISHASSIGFSPKVIYDGGGFDGKWCMKVASIFPDAEFVMFEPNPNMKARIIDNTAPIKTRVHLVQKALADKAGTAHFNIWKDADNDASASLLGHVQGDASTQLEVELTTIDAVAEETGKWPDLIKLDLQGAEGPALEGARKALEKAEMVIAEFGVLDAYKERTRCTQLLSILERSGFQLYDIVDLHYRPYDGALTGGDFFFVKKTSKLKAYAGYD